MSDKKLKSVIYLRVSTSDQDSRNQLSQLKDYAKKQEWQVVEVIEDTISGGKGIEGRTGFKKVFEMAHKGTYDVLLFWSLDRFSREGSRRTLEYLTMLDSCKVKWHSYTEPYISSLGVFSDAIISILSAIARQEKIRISERTIAGLKRVAESGVKLGRPRISKTISQKARELRKKGLSFSEIGKELGYSRIRAYQLCNGI